MLDSDMTEQGHNNLSAGGETDKLADEFIPAEARPLCLKCLKPCHPLQHYCDSCDSNDAINPLTPYMPFLNIWFNYGIFLTMWRKLWYDKDALIISRLCCLFMIIMFTPIMLIVGFPPFLIGKIPEPELRKITVVAFYIIAILLLMIFLYFNLFQGAISPITAY